MGQPLMVIKVQIAEGASKLMDIFRDQAAKVKEADRKDDNEFNIRKSFIENSVAIIRDATLSQFNIVVCTDQDKDDFQDLQGRILPMDLIDVEISPGKYANFQVYVFETGKYLRRGRWELDAWGWWGSDKSWKDVNYHVHFETAQKKLNPDEIKAKQAEIEAQKKVVDDAAKAAKDAEALAVADNEKQLEGEADVKLDEKGQIEEGEREDKEIPVRTAPKTIKSKGEEDDEEEDEAGGEDEEEGDEGEEGDEEEGGDEKDEGDEEDGAEGEEEGEGEGEEEEGAEDEEEDKEADDEEEEGEEDKDADEGDEEGEDEEGEGEEAGEEEGAGDEEEEGEGEEEDAEDGEEEEGDGDKGPEEEDEEEENPKSKGGKKGKKSKDDEEEEEEEQ
ncbi:putative Sodium/potassium/calcium exchanger 1 [Glarea lozoyensis 74030]|uniref:Putative Sodium/potassium/calcium exchanger 1 n=1 Tax=Glarea lozoyensis (strain ATCC 74030 / MF5533) TaxID=1104152 RepID=H0EUB3_GLAL7|nr:putative Sodium/potassium/calcium exchanger 1 [Glarea lozoyensis 74030]